MNSSIENIVNPQITFIVRWIRIKDCNTHLSISAIPKQHRDTIVIASKCSYTVFQIVTKYHEIELRKVPDLHETHFCYNLCKIQGFNETRNPNVFLVVA